MGGRSGNVDRIVLLEFALISVFELQGEIIATRAVQHGYTDASYVSFRDSNFYPSDIAYNGKGIPLSNLTDSIKIAAQKFPNLNACLSVSPKASRRLEDFDWKSMENYDEVRVCVFYIANTLGTKELTAAWFKESGFSVSFASNAIPIRQDHIIATWNTSRGYKYSVGSFSGRVLRLIMHPYAQIISTTWSVDGRLWSVDLYDLSL